MAKSPTPSEFVVFELMNCILLTDYTEAHKLCFSIFIWIKSLLLQR
jgi:hypothetical protein